jgi:hypothetical protein
MSIFLFLYLSLLIFVYFIFGNIKSKGDTLFSYKFYIRYIIFHVLYSTTLSSLIKEYNLANFVGKLMCPILNPTQFSKLQLSSKQEETRNKVAV